VVLEFGSLFIDNQLDMILSECGKRMFTGMGGEINGLQILSSMDEITNLYQREFY
jgi:hypothetical protein